MSLNLEGNKDLFTKIQLLIVIFDFSCGGVKILLCINYVEIDFFDQCSCLKSLTYTLVSI